MKMSLKLPGGAYDASLVQSDQVQNVFVLSLLPAFDRPLQAFTWVPTVEVGHEYLLPDLRDPPDTLLQELLVPA